MRLVFGLRKPKPVRTSDLAGEVVEVGNQVDGFQPGDAVYGEGDAAFAEYAKVTPTAISLMPDNLSFEEAAVVLIAGQTALLCIRDIGGVQPRQRVLIIGAAGGVGTFAVQVAKALGAKVTAGSGSSADWSGPWRSHRLSATSSGTSEEAKGWARPSSQSDLAAEKRSGSAALAECGRG